MCKSQKLLAIFRSQKRTISHQQCPHWPVDNSALPAPALHDTRSIGGSTRHFGKITGRELKLDFQGSSLMMRDNSLVLRTFSSARFWRLYRRIVFMVQP
jgi:hypothetical protein